MYRPHFVSPLIHQWILSLLPSFGYTEPFAAMKMGVQHLFKALLPILLDMYLGVELLDYEIILFRVLRTHHTSFHSSCTIVYSHQRCTETPISPHPCQHLQFSGLPLLFVWQPSWWVCSFRGLTFSIRISETPTSQYWFASSTLTVFFDKVVN